MQRDVLYHMVRLHCPVVENGRAFSVVKKRTVLFHKVFPLYPGEICRRPEARPDEPYHHIRESAHQPGKVLDNRNIVSQVVADIRGTFRLLIDIVPDAGEPYIIVGILREKIQHCRYRVQHIACTTGTVFQQCLDGLHEKDAAGGIGQQLRIKLFLRCQVQVRIGFQEYRGNSRLIVRTKAIDKRQPVRHFHQERLHTGIVEKRLGNVILQTGQGHELEAILHICYGQIRESVGRLCPEHIVRSIFHGIKSKVQEVECQHRITGSKERDKIHQGMSTVQGSIRSYRGLHLQQHIVAYLGPHIIYHMPVNGSHHGIMVFRFIGKVQRCKGGIPGSEQSIYQLQLLQVIGIVKPY